ncbi:MAG: structural protein [Alphaproteobacteria bacterium]
MNPDQSGDPRFVVFLAPEWGIRAIARVLRTYRDKHGLTTVRGIIGRWAPPKENDTGAYVRSVAERCGVGPDDDVDIDDVAVMRELVKAIIRHENGRPPDGGDWYDDAVIDDGISRA